MLSLLSASFLRKINEPFCFENVSNLNNEFFCIRNYGKFSCSNCHKKTHVSNVMHFQGEMTRKRSEAKVLSICLSFKHYYVNFLA